MRRRDCFLACALVLGLHHVSAAADVRLITAVRGRDWPAMKALIDARVDVNARQPDGATALHWAVYYDERDAADSLIRAGADVNVQNDLGVSPLYLACENADREMVESLLRAGARPNVALPSGETPLMTAARSGDAEVVSALIRSGGDVNAREKRDAQTALMWAVSRRRPQVVAALLAAGADVHARSGKYEKVVMRRSGGSESDGGVEAMEFGGYTPLLFASRVGDVESARLLLASGANVNDTTPPGVSALAVATHSGQTPLALLLLEKGADPNAASAGYAPLHLAVLRDDRVLQEALLSRGADPNVRLVKGTVVSRQAKYFMINGALAGATPFFLAAKYADARAMQLLVSHGADPLLGLPSGATPLMAAAGMFTRGFGRGGSDRRDRDLDTTENETGLSQDEDTRPLLNSGIDAVKLAVELGADVNAATANGDTAVHAAAALGFDTVIRYLASKGAKVDVKNKRGRTPMMVAASQKDADDKSIATQTVDLLRQLAAEQNATPKAGSAAPANP